MLPVVVREQFAVMPRLESLAVVKGEHVCTNEDIIRNAAYSWSPMTADEIEEKTGIKQRLYTERRLEHISLQAARAALDGAGRRPEEIGAVIFCSCTSTRLIPSVATWLSGQLGIFQTHGSFDLIAACAGFPYGLGEAVRLLQEVEAPRARRLRREVLRQDRQRPPVADDLRRRGGCARRRARGAGCAARRRGRADLRQRARSAR